MSRSILRPHVLAVELVLLADKVQRAGQKGEAFFETLDQARKALKEEFDPPFLQVGWVVL